MTSVGGELVVLPPPTEVSAGASAGGSEDVPSRTVPELGVTDAADRLSAANCA